MRLFRDYTSIGPDDRGASVAIGNFDGVHLGHRAILDLARAKAQAAAAPLGVVTFEPHPREVFAPDAPPFRLMNAAARATRLAQLGIERLFELPFDAGLAGLEARAFAQEVLTDGLGLSHVVVGTDFRFGAGRKGDALALKEFGAEMGFGVTIADLVEDGDARISSTSIRTALSEGAPDRAARMLGHLHRIEGTVLHGEKRGRALGYPTANMSVAGLHLPKFGVYAVDVDVLSGPQQGRYGGVASLGVRPMFGENQPNLETYLFDFEGDLYGQTVSVGLVAYLRGEEKFDGLESLITQMDADSAQARALLAGA